MSNFFVWGFDVFGETRLSLLLVNQVQQESEQKTNIVFVYCTELYICVYLRRTVLHFICVLFLS